MFDEIEVSSNDKKPEQMYCLPNGEWVYLSTVTKIYSLDNKIYISFSEGIPPSIFEDKNKKDTMKEIADLVNMVRRSGV